VRNVGPNRQGGAVWSSFNLHPFAENPENREIGKANCFALPL